MEYKILRMKELKPNKVTVAWLMTHVQGMIIECDDYRIIWPSNRDRVSTEEFRRREVRPVYILQLSNGQYTSLLAICFGEDNMTAIDINGYLDNLGGTLDVIASTLLGGQNVI